MLIDTFETIAPALGLIVPLLVAWLSKRRADAGVKRAVTIMVCVAVAALSLAAQDWSGASARDLTERFLLILGQSQALYWVVNAWLEGILKREGGLNQLGVFLPERGLE